MLVVIDTNVLLVSISKKSKYHWLYRLVLDNKIQIAITHEILSEYEEQINFRWHPEAAIDVIRSLSELSNTHFSIIYFHLNLITTDVDDNKFVDCAFAANADYIITNDNHFNVLQNIDFPKIPIIRLEKFEELFKDKL